ncbi:condensation domain-containing protein, partial [Burkholderia gladioli]
MVREFGQDRRLVAWLVPDAPSADADASLADWRAALLRQLPDYMVPAHFVLLQALPLTPNGKLDRRALPAPEFDAASAGQRVPPVGDTETRLAQLWGELLQRSPVGRDDHFFETGGHSLLATQLLSRVRQQWRIELPLRALFEDPTLASFARRIDGARPARAATPLVPIGRDAALRLSFGQQRLWFLEQLQPGNPAYHIPLAVRIDGALDVAAFEQAFSWLVARHEMLRTTFATHEGEPVQIIAPPAPLPVIHHALVSLTEDERKEALRRLSSNHAS